MPAAARLVWQSANHQFLTPSTKGQTPGYPVGCLVHQTHSINIKAPESLNKHQGSCTIHTRLLSLLAHLSAMLQPPRCSYILQPASIALQKLGFRERVGKLSGQSQHGWCYNQHVVAIPINCHDLDDTKACWKYSCAQPVATSLTVCHEASTMRCDRSWKVLRIFTAYTVDRDLPHCASSCLMSVSTMFIMVRVTSQVVCWFVWEVIIGHVLSWGLLKSRCRFRNL